MHASPPMCDRRESISLNYIVLTFMFVGIEAWKAERKVAYSNLYQSRAYRAVADC